MNGGRMSDNIAELQKYGDAYMKKIQKERTAIVFFKDFTYIS